jgi:hypothetical protein
VPEPEHPDFLQFRLALQSTWPTDSCWLALSIRGRFGRGERMWIGWAIVYVTKQRLDDTPAGRDRPVNENDAIKAAADVIRRWEHDGHWSAIPEAERILEIYRNSNCIV